MLESFLLQISSNGFEAISQNHFERYIYLYFCMRFLIKFKNRSAYCIIFMLFCYVIKISLNASFLQMASSLGHIIT